MVGVHVVMGVVGVLGGEGVLMGFVIVDDGVLMGFVMVDDGGVDVLMPWSKLLIFFCCAVDATE